MKFEHETGEWIADPSKQGQYEVKTWWRTLDDFILSLGAQLEPLALAACPPEPVCST
jgi:hypothetical protein